MKKYPSLSELTAEQEKAFTPFVDLCTGYYWFILRGINEKHYALNIKKLHRLSAMLYNKDRKFQWLSDLVDEYFSESVRTSYYYEIAVYLAYKSYEFPKN